MNATAAAFQVTVADDTIVIGHHPDAPRRTVRQVEVRFEDTVEVFYLHGERYLVPCVWCTRGTKIEFGHVFGGVCFQCRGYGYSKVHDSVEAIEKVTRRRVRDRQRAERKAAERAEADAAALVAWREANPEAVKIVDEIMAEAEADQEEGRSSGAWAARWGFAAEIAMQASYRALSDKQVAAMVKAYEEAKVKHAAEVERAAQQRYLGQVGDKIEVHGTVVVAVPVDTQFGRSMLVIVEGVGEHVGVTVKAFGSGKTLWDAERDQEVTISGTVKDHEQRDDVAQTVVTRSKVVAR